VVVVSGGGGGFWCVCVCECVCVYVTILARGMCGMYSTVLCGCCRLLLYRYIVLMWPGWMEMENFVWYVPV